MAVLHHQGWRDGVERWAVVGERTCRVEVDEHGGATHITGEGQYYYYSTEWAGFQAAMAWADKA